MALIASAVAFALVLLYRLRPQIVSARRPVRERLKKAKAALVLAKTDSERAAALAEAADACSESRGIRRLAYGYYFRALRLEPNSLPLIQRATVGLSRRPHELESLLWRRLGSSDWDEEAMPVLTVCLEELAHLYGTRLHQGARARALRFALARIAKASAREDASQ